MIQFIYPSICAKCSNKVFNNNDFCPSCWKGILFISDPYCAKCGSPLISQFYNDDHLCKAQNHCYDMVKSAIVYNDFAKEMIAKFKYEDQIYLSMPLSSLLIKCIASLIDSVHLIATVPMHSIHLRERKYNPSAILASDVAKHYDKLFIADLLIKKTKTKRQNLLTLKERQVNLKNAFIVNGKYQDMIKNKVILLIDDIITTGNTVNECSKALLKCGAKKVYIGTVAKTMLYREKV